VGLRRHGGRGEDNHACNAIPAVSHANRPDVAITFTMKASTTTASPRPGRRAFKPGVVVVVAGVVVVVASVTAATSKDEADSKAGRAGKSEAMMLPQR